MEQKKKCRYCGKGFVTTSVRRIYCCDTCKKRHYYELKHSWNRTLVCETCGRMFTAKSAQKYCSEHCRKIATSMRKRKNVLTRTPSMTIEQVALLSRKEGLSYGQYVAKHRLK